MGNPQPSFYVREPLWGLVVGYEEGSETKCQWVTKDGLTNPMWLKI